MERIIHIRKSRFQFIMFLSLLTCISLMVPSVYAGGIFLNGVDISSARNQNLKNVNVSISEDGTVFIEAPHYQVREDDIFSSLGKTSKGRFSGIARGEEKAVGKKGGTHPNSQVDPSTLPTYKEFQTLSSKELKARSKTEDDEEGLDSSEKSGTVTDRRARRLEAELQDENNRISPQEAQALNIKEDKQVKTNKTTRKNSGNLLRRDEREERSR